MFFTGGKDFLKSFLGIWSLHPGISNMPFSFSNRKWNLLERKYKGHLLITCVANGDNGTMRIAYAVAESESESS